jgi:tetratricopeptide (TPR) repeat protein
LPSEALRERDPPIGDVTTHSPEAYRYYLEGREHHSKFYYSEAERGFRKAVESDSTFAMAYYHLANLAKGAEREEMIAKAVKYSDTVSQKERYYIKARAADLSGDRDRAIEELEHLLEYCPDEKVASLLLGIRYRFLGQYEKSIHYSNRAIEIDPLYRNAYNELAYAYDIVGDFDKSIWAINKYISLAPDEANPYDSRGDLYAWNGRIDQAIESYRKAREVKPEWDPPYVKGKLGHMYLFKREYEKADSCYQMLCTSTDELTRAQARTFLAYIPLYQGKFEEALRVLDDGIAADRIERAGAGQVAKYGLKSMIYEERNQLDLALKETEKCIEVRQRIAPEDIPYMSSHHARLLAKTGDFERAEQVAETLKRDIEEKDESQMLWYWVAVGYIESARGNTNEAIVNFDRAVGEGSSFWMRYLLGSAYLEPGRLGEAVAEFERMLSRYDWIRAHNAIQAVKSYYLLGLAYEESGWGNKAIEQYEEFLEIWKNADPGIPEIEDARERLAKLKQAS